MNSIISPNLVKKEFTITTGTEKYYGNYYGVHTLTSEEQSQLVSLHVSNVGNNIPTMLQLIRNGETIMVLTPDPSINVVVRAFFRS